MPTLDSMNRLRKNAGLRQISSVKQLPRTSQYVTQREILDPNKNVVQQGKTVRNPPAEIATSRQDFVHQQRIFGALRPTQGLQEQYITVKTPAGEISYPKSDWEAIADEEGNVTGVKGRDSGASISNPAELKPLLDQGKITQEQYNASLAGLQFSPAINPYGFSGAVSSVDVERARKKKEQTTSLLYGRAKGKDYVNQVLGQYGFPTDGSDPFAEFRNPKFDYGQYVNRLFQGSSTYSEAQRQANDLFERMRLFDKIKRGEQLTREDEQILASVGEEVSGVEKGHQESQTREQEKIEEQNRMKDEAATNVNRAAVTSTFQSYLSSLPLEDQILVAPYQGVFEAMSQLESVQSSNLSSINALADAYLKGATRLADEMSSRYTKNKNDWDTLLGKIKRDSITNLERSKENAINRSIADEAARHRSMEKAKSKRIEQMTNVLALSGGYGSSNGNAEIAEAEYDAEIAIQEMHTEYSLSKSDLEAKYTEQYNGIQNDYMSKLLEARSKYDDKMDAIDQMEFTSLTKSIEMKTNAQNNFYKERAQVKVEKAKAITDMNKEVRAENNKDKDRKLLEEKQKKDAAYQFMNFAFTQSKDSKLRESAVNDMRKAGYELPEGIDMNADPISFQLSLMNNAAKTTASSASDPFRFTGEGSNEKQALAASALTVIGQMEGGVELNKSQLSYVNQLLDRREVDKAKAHLRGLAVASLKGPQENAFAARSTIISASKTLLTDLKSIQDSKKGKTLFEGLRDAWQPLEGKSITDLSADDFDIYNKAISNLRQKMGADSDPALKRVFAQIENIAALVINERYGAAVTDGEMERAREYIAMSGNTLGDTIVKLEEFSKFSKLQNEVMLNTKMGLSSDEIDMGAPDVNSSPAIPSDADFNKMFLSQNDQPSQIQIGSRTVKGSPKLVSALEQADAEFFAAHGRHLEINSDFRSTEQQAKAYERYQRGEIELAAPPGASLHEKGAAVDVTNWKEAEPYLIKYGLKPLPKHLRSKDPAHFQLI